MPLQFKTMVVERAQRDSVFRKALLIEAINELLKGNLATAKNTLRDYIKSL